jgi:DNA topoisomerase II
VGKNDRRVSIMYNCLTTASPIFQRRRILSNVARHVPLRRFLTNVRPLSRQLPLAIAVSNPATCYRRSSSNLQVIKASNIEEIESLAKKRLSEISVEEQYIRKTPLEHVLLRPGMYVGPNERAASIPYWLLDPTPSKPEPDFVQTSSEDPTTIQNVSKGKINFTMQKLDCAIIPALVKVFDEILVNAFDNRLRTTESSSRIDVIIDPGNEITNREPLLLVYNDGKGVPIQMHQVEKMYVPELIFGNLLTGSNFDDTQERLTGGRHGYGAKLANIFSKSFTVETCDTQRRLKYKQTWYNNMKQSSEPIITNSNSTSKDYTCVSFVPDLQRLTGDTQAKSISDVDYAVMCRRVVDIAGAAAGSLHVTLNGVDVSQSSFIEYVQMYRTSDSPPIFCQSVNDRWKVGVGLSDSGSFDNISFVNGLTTTRGGTHINMIVQQLTKRIHDEIERQHPDLLTFIPQSLIRRHLFIFCDAQIVNPAFDSQMKECLTSAPSSFGSTCEFSEEMMKMMLMKSEDGGTGIIEEMIRVAQGRQRASLTKDFGKVKTKRQLLSIPKLEDAHYAGTNNGYKCTLILTEGDSAKALAVSGLEVIGRKHFGVFPLRGKLLNVRDSKISKLQTNLEIKSLCSILGLDFTKSYETLDERHELRYGHVMLMTDQDTGKHFRFI